MLTPLGERSARYRSTGGRDGVEQRSDRRELAPGLNPEGAYLSRLSARSALYTDLRILLGRLEEPLPAASYRSLVLDENRLVRSSVAGRRKIWMELKNRYLLDRDHPLFLAFSAEWVRCRSEPERGLAAYALLALNDRLVADLGTQWLFPLLRRAPAELRVEEVLAFLQRSASRHPETLEWSTETRTAVAQKYLASLRDFGLAQGKVRKVAIRPALYGAPIRLLVRALRLTGAKDLDVVRAPIFRLLGLDGIEVIDALADLHRKRELRFKMQGDVVDLEVESGS
jgi:hypothetical protein